MGLLKIFRKFRNNNECGPNQHGTSMLRTCNTSSPIAGETKHETKHTVSEYIQSVITVNLLKIHNSVHKLNLEITDSEISPIAEEIYKRRIDVLPSTDNDPEEQYYDWLFAKNILIIENINKAVTEATKNNRLYGVLDLNQEDFIEKYKQILLFQINITQKNNLYNLLTATVDLSNLIANLANYGEYHNGSTITYEQTVRR